MRRKTLSAIAASALIAAASFVMPAKAQDRTELGVLDCIVEGGFGLLITSSKDMTCTFTHRNGTVERYTGRIDKLGLDVGVTGDAFMKWLVFTPLGNQAGSYALAGRYVGASAGASLGIGLGANALIGGSDRKIGLQPVSVEANTGVNLAIGLASLTLNPA